MSEKRYRIAGSDSDLARSYPDVAKTLSISGRNMSNICYGCVALFIRCLGFCPQSREEVKEMSALIKTINDHNVRPWLITSSGSLLLFFHYIHQSFQNYSHLHRIYHLIQVYAFLSIIILLNST